METLKRVENMNQEVLIKLRDFHFSTSFFEQAYTDVVSGLLRSFDPSRGIPLFLDDPTNYYTSTTSTALLALHHMNLLDPYLRKKFHDVLFWLRDHTKNSIVKEKKQEDAVAWDVSESASVWATSLATWALLETGYRGKKIDEIKEALFWLIDQKNPDGGWGFDGVCKSRVYFTSLALHSLRLGKSLLPLNRREISRVNKSLESGTQYIYTKRIEEGNIAHWDDDPTSTLYALRSLHEENKEDYKDLINKGLGYIKNKLRGTEIWEIEEFVIETAADTKYGTQKVIISFTPSMPIVLLRLGVSPFDDVCIKPLVYLQKSRLEKGWNLPDHIEAPLSFTTALALWTINEWHRHVIKTVLKKTRKHPFVLRSLRKRITLLIIMFAGTAIVSASVYIKIPQIIGDFLSHILNEYGPFISLVGSALAILGASGLIPLIKFIDQRILNNRISDALRSFIRALRNFVYVE